MTGVWILLAAWLGGNATLLGLACRAERKGRRPAPRAANDTTTTRRTTA